MPELTAEDVSTFTDGRLPNDESTTDLLNAALAAARRYVGWHVSPVIEETVVVDGPGGDVLSLPTRNLIEVSSVVENGVTLNVSRLDVSRRKGTVKKYPYGWWTSRDGGITVTMSHGYTEAEASDWRRAILRLVDTMSYETVTTRSDPALKREKVDDTEQEWFDKVISTDERLAMTLSQFRILPSP